MEKTRASKNSRTLPIPFLVDHTDMFYYSRASPILFYLYPQTLKFINDKSLFISNLTFLKIPSYSKFETIIVQYLNYAVEIKLLLIY